LKPGKDPVDRPRYLSCFDGDLQEEAEQVLHWLETVDHLGDAVPYYGFEFGADTFAAYLGAELKLAADRGTSWATPFVKNWDDTEITFHNNGHWWQRTLEVIAAFRSRFDGQLLICPPTLVANLDALAAIRGIENLLLDMMLTPHKIADAMQQICRVHTTVMSAYAKALSWDTIGCIGGEGTYIEGRQSRPQCDMSCMISPQMFEAFVKPCLVSEAQDADAFVYHLDGSGSLKHVDALCSLPEIDLIGYIPDQGKEQWGYSKSLYDRIDYHNKGQVFYSFSGLSHGDIKKIWREYRSKKLVFHTSVRSKSEAEDLIGELTTIEKMPR